MKILKRLRNEIRVGFSAEDPSHACASVRLKHSPILVFVGKTPDPNTYELSVYDERTETILLNKQIKTGTITIEDV